MTTKLLIKHEGGPADKNVNILITRKYDLPQDTREAVIELKPGGFIQTFVWKGAIIEIQEAPQK